MLHLSVAVAAPPARTFEVFTDLRRAPEHLSGVTKLEVLEPGPIGEGTRFRETRVMFGKEHTETMEVTDFQPDSGYTVGCTSCGCEFSTVFRFRPAGGGTQVDMRTSMRPLTLAAKMLSPITGWMTKGAMRKAMQEDLDELRRAAEAGASV